jgi:hypothetical protein
MFFLNVITVHRRYHSIWLDYTTFALPIVINPLARWKIKPKIQYWRWHFLFRSNLLTSFYFVLSPCGCSLSSQLTHLLLVKKENFANYSCLALCWDCLSGEYWFRLSRYVYDGNRSFTPILRWSRWSLLYDVYWLKIMMLNTWTGTRVRDRNTWTRFRIRIFPFSFEQ